MDYNNENSSIDDYESFLLELNSNFTLSIYINGPVLASFTLITAIITFIGNLFVLIATQTDPKLRFRPSSIFLNNLLLGDLIRIVAVAPFAVITGFSGQWIFGSTIIEKYRFCQFVGFMLWYSALVVTSTLAVISFDRWLFIIKPMIYKRFMKLPTALTIVILLWIVCAALNTTNFYGLGNIHFAPEQGICITGAVNKDIQYIYVIYMLIIFGTLIAVIVVTSIWTCCFTRNFLARSQAKSQNHQLYASKKRRVCGIFSALLIVCAACYVPSMIVTITAAVVYMPDVVYALLSASISFFFSFNPFIQSFFRPDVKKVIILMWNVTIKKLQIQLPCKKKTTKDKNETISMSAL